MVVIQSVLSGLIELLRPYASLIFPMFFIGFFLATLVAFIYNKNRHIRRAYVGGFMSLMIASNLFLPTPAPFVKWHKFSEARQDEMIRHEIRVVDTSGNEITYDNSATWAADGMSMNLARQIIMNRPTPEKRQEVSEYLLQEAREHRTHLRNRSALHIFRFPPHGPSNTWVATELEAYDEFIGIRIYRMELKTSSDGTEITGYSEEVVYEYVRDEMATEATRAPANDTAVNIHTARPRIECPFTGSKLPI